MRVLLHIFCMLFFVNNISAKPPGVSPETKMYINFSQNPDEYNKFLNDCIIKKNLCVTDISDIVYDYDSGPTTEGGYKEALIFLMKNIRYPSIARENDIEGKVIAKLIVNENGDICNLQITRTVGFGLDEEAIRVITSSAFPKLIPAKKNGKNVKAYLLFPVMFKLA